MDRVSAGLRGFCQENRDGQLGFKAAAFAAQALPAVGISHDVAEFSRHTFMPPQGLSSAEDASSDSFPHHDVDEDFQIVSYSKPILVQSCNIRVIAQK